MREERRKWREQQHEIALDVGQQRLRHLRAEFVFRGIQFVQQLHDRGDRGIEMPATLKIRSYAPDGLVQLALQPTSYGRQALVGRDLRTNRTPRRTRTNLSRNPRVT